jgi:hypothetical protein
MCVPPESGNSAENPEFRKMRTGINRNTGRNAQPRSEAEEKSVSTESDVVAHHSRIHSYQFHREGVGDKFHFDLDCTAHNLDDA